MMQSGNRFGTKTRRWEREGAEKRIGTTACAEHRPGDSTGAAASPPLSLSRVLTFSLSAVASAAAPTQLDVKARGIRTFYADGRAGNNQVSVFSESTLEDFTIVCNEVAGEFRLDPQNLESLAGEFSLRVADMKSGIELRDSHMRDADWLDAANHPRVTVRVERVEDVRKTGSNSASLTLAGSCEIRGVTRPVRVPCTLAYLDESPETMRRVKGDLVRIRGDFEVKLSDYGITGPRGSDTIGLKVADTLRIKVTVFGSTERPPQALKVDTGRSTTRPAATQPAKTGAATRRSVLQPPSR